MRQILESISRNYIISAGANIILFFPKINSLTVRDETSRVLITRNKSLFSDCSMSFRLNLNVFEFIVAHLS
jgi:hypothetical protein